MAPLESRYFPNGASAQLAIIQSLEILPLYAVRSWKTASALSSRKAGFYSLILLNSIISGFRGSGQATWAVSLSSS